MLSAVKEAEDGKGTILRVYNPVGKEVGGTIRFVRPVREAWKARLDETALDRIKLDDGHAIRVNVPPHGIVTIKVL